MAPFRIIIVWSVVLGSAVAGSAVAQALPQQIAAELSAASKARVRLRNGTWITLDGPKAESSNITYRYGEFLNRGGTRVAIPGPLRVDQLSHIQISRGSHAAKGAKLGGGIGAGLGVVLFAVAAVDDPGYFSTGESIQGTITLALFGAALGALIGSGSPRWQTVYTVPSP